MTKEHFIAFAKYIKNFPVSGQSGIKVELADMVIAIAREDNKNFDKARFLKACGLEN